MLFNRFNMNGKMTAKATSGCLVLLILSGIVVAAFAISETTPDYTVASSTEILQKERVTPHIDDSGSIERKKPKNLHQYSVKPYCHTGGSSGVVLYNDGNPIYTGMTDEQIIDQLSLDYQDLYDYYGGAEELY